MTTNNTQGICSTMLQQIGMGNVLAISGGRVERIAETTIALPVRQGYSVHVEYKQGSDTYTVSRIFRRGMKIWVKGEQSNIYAEQLGDTCYRASCYLDDFAS